MKSQAVTILPPEDDDPKWPATLALEIALEGRDPTDVCGKYGISKDKFDVIRDDPRFRAQLDEADAALRKPNARFKAKAGVYSEEMLDTLRRIAKGEGAAPANVRSDSAKTIIKIAGLDASENRAQAGAAGLVININLA